jgi:hypothetical protein
LSLFPEALSSEKINYWHANARLLAALRFLEHIEITAKDNKEAVSLRKLAANSDYAEIITPGTMADHLAQRAC